MKKKPSTTAEYFDQFPEDIKRKLKSIQAEVKKLFPAAEESISYGMPAFHLHKKQLIYFAGYKTHIGMYPVPNDKSFEKEYARYETSGKGTIRFPLDKALPLPLIRKIVKFRAKRIAEELTAQKK